MDSKAAREVKRLRSQWPEMKRAIKGAWIAAALLGVVFAFLAVLAAGDPGLTGEPPFLNFIAAFFFVAVPGGVVLSVLCIAFIALAPSRSSGGESI